MSEPTPYSSAKLLKYYTVLAVPAAGLILLLVSWLLPQLGIPRALGAAFFLSGWVLMAFTSAAARQGVPASQRVRKFLFALIFFPVLYPVAVALAPYAARLRRDMLRNQNEPEEPL